MLALSWWGILWLSVGVLVLAAVVVGIWLYPRDNSF